MEQELFVNNNGTIISSTGPSFMQEIEDTLTATTV